MWSVERRENLLEDQSVLDLYKQGKVTATQLYDYYLGYLKDPSITRTSPAVPDSSVAFAKQWGMNVAVQDLHTVITAAQKLGGKVVLGGHSLGGSVVTAYATWDFAGHAGADELAGLVYIDGGSYRRAASPRRPPRTLAALDAPAVTPWLAFGGIAGALRRGVQRHRARSARSLDPNAPVARAVLGRSCRPIWCPPMPVTNIGQYGYALNAGDVPADLFGRPGPPRRRPDRGPARLERRRCPHPDHALRHDVLRLPDAGRRRHRVVLPAAPDRSTPGRSDNGNANPAQAVLGVHATMGHHLPKALRIYAFGARLEGAVVLSDARALAEQSHIPAGNLTLVNRQGTYSHNDPAGAYPHNAFFAHLVPFLKCIAR